MSEPLSRRDALKTVTVLLGVGGAVRMRQASAQNLPHLAANDPAGMALGYHETASTVDSKQFPTFQQGQTCTTCLQLQGTPGQPWRPCSIFPGKLVAADGWCRVWTKKP